MKKLLLTSLLGILGITMSMAQISMTVAGYSENFNSLESSGTSGTLPTGWELIETGGFENADNLYRASDGSSGLFDTFSFGDTSDPERALGSRRDGTKDIEILFGAEFINDTGETIVGFTVQYECEQWSLGSDNAIQDVLRFEISSTATSLDDNTGFIESIGLSGRSAWDREFNFPPFLVVLVGPLDGNLGGTNGNITSYDGTATLNNDILPGETFYVRWTDENPMEVGDTQDGLGIDNLVITPIVASPVDTEVFFRDPPNRAVSESEGFANISIDVRNASATNDVTFDLVLISGDPADIGDYTTRSVTIPANNSGTAEPITITDNTIEEGDKLFVFEIQNISGGDNAMILTPDQFELSVLEDDFDNIFYRSISSGFWDDAGIWESSTDSSNWVPASVSPDFSRNSIAISAGDRVEIRTIIEIDQTFVLGELVLDGGALTINDGLGTDLTIFDTYDHLTGTEISFDTDATVRVKANGGRIVVSGTTGNPSVYGTSTAITYENNAEFNWTVNAVPNSGTYFPNTPDDGTTPRFRIANVTLDIGSDNADFIVNGIFTIRSGNAVSFGGTGLKVLRDGLGGPGDFTQQAGSGQIQITGTDALIGGSSGTYNLNDTQGMLIAAGSNATVGGGAVKTFNGGKLTVDGTLDFLTSDNKVFTFTHSGAGTVGLDGAGTIDVSGGDHVINIASESPTFATTFLPGTESTVDFNGDDSQNIPALSFANLTSSGTGDRVLASTGTIEVSQVFTPGANTYTTTGSTLSYTGADQDVAGLNYFNITAAGTGTKTLATTATVTSYLTIADGVTFDANAQSLTLLSSATETASLTQMPAGASFVGELTAQRYSAADGSRIYRYMSSPVNAPAISQLQDDLIITGDFIGSDPLTNQPSFFLYDETDLSDVFNDGYIAQPVTINSETMMNGVGYALFIWQGNSPVVWDLTGAPNVGNFSFTITYSEDTPPNPNNDGWNLLGNPYPSAIDWENPGWTSVNIADAVYIRDEVNDTFASWVAGVGVNGGTGRIASGQAFWVQATGDGASLDITEEVKSVQNDTEFFREGNVEMDVVRLTLKNDSRQDEIAIRLDKDGLGTFQQSLDALKFTGNAPMPEEGIKPMEFSSLSSEGYKLAINTVANQGCEINIPLSIDGLDVGVQYGIDVSGFANMTTHYTGEIVDLETGDIFEVDESKSFDFIAERESETRFAMRLTMHMELPQLTFEEGVLSTDVNNPVWYYNGIELTDQSSQSFVPQRSGTYEVVYAKSECSAKNEIDIIVDGKGFLSYFSVAPNPMRETLNLQSYANLGNDVELSLMDIQGRVYLTESMYMNRGYYQFDVSNLPTGVYILKIASADQVFTHRLMKQ